MAGHRFGRRRGGFLKGCLIALVIVGLLAGLGVWFVARNWRGWVAPGLQMASDELVASMPISDAERGEVKPIMDGLIAEFKAGTISMPEAMQVLQQLETSPIVAVMGAGLVGSQYIEPSSLSAEEKTAAQLEIGRVARGLQEGTIAQTKLAEITAPIQGAGGTQIQIGSVSLQLKQPSAVTAEELNQLVTNAKAAADTAGVPAEAFEIDASAELERMFTGAIGRVPGQGGGTTP